MPDAARAEIDELERHLTWDVPVREGGLVLGVLAMTATAVVCWPSALSYGVAILASRRRRYRTAAWVGVVLGCVGAVLTVVVSVIVATSD